jgi:2-polyprenyl-3-methyl-5-hydroxy-6-metoxy-1,4-benzoquinol methylase
MTKNENDRYIEKQWDDAAEAWADFVRTGKDWTRLEMNNPAMFEMLGDIRGKKVLDLGCGEGFNTRLMARKGAVVTGIDFSREIIKFAIEEENRESLGIDYHVASANDLSIFEERTFDIVASFMAIQDVEDYRGAIKETGRVLKDDGRFVFAIPHPCFEVRILDGRRIGGWVYEEGTDIKDKESALNQKLDRTPLYYTMDLYFDTRSDIIDWNMERLTKHFKTSSFHRTLTDYSIALRDAGLLISRMLEPLPTKKGLEEHPVYFKGNLRIPHSIVFEAVKP